MRHHALAPLAAAATLAVAGCEEKAKTPTAAASEEPVPAATALPPKQPDFVGSQEIPTPIRGRWGLVPADCIGDPAAAKGLITIDAWSIKFYESVARLGNMKKSDADAIDATFSFSGEGRAWMLDVDLHLENGGKTLIRQDTGKDAMPGVLKYTQCS